MSKYDLAYKKFEELKDIDSLDSADGVVIFEGGIPKKNINLADIFTLLQSYELSYLTLNKTSGYTPAEGELAWDDNNKVLVFGTTGGSVVQVSQEMPFRCRNMSGGIIENGQLVYLTGKTGGFFNVDLADNSSEATAKGTIAMCTTAEGVGNNQYGKLLM